MPYIWEMSDSKSRPSPTLSSEHCTLCTDNYQHNHLSFFAWVSFQRSTRKAKIREQLAAVGYKQCFSIFSVFLGAFAKLRKATISFVMSVCPPARIE
jgi:hypothetical protein